jgi:hypothetical protein
MTLARRILAWSALVAVPPAFAQPAPHWYAGVAGGQSRTGHELVSNRESTVVNATGVESDFDANDGGWKVFAGWRATGYLSLEASYADLGKSRLVTRTVSIDGLPGAVELRRDVTAYALDAVLTAPVGPRFAVFGRAGAARSRLRADATLDGGIVFTNGSPDERSRGVSRDETVAHFGLGAEWRLPNATLRLEWERFHDVGKAFEIGGTGTTGEADTDLVSLGVLVRF